MKKFNKTSIAIAMAFAFILVSCSGDSDPVEPIPTMLTHPLHTVGLMITVKRLLVLVVKQLDFNKLL